MAFAKFSLFQSHIDLAHRYWTQLISIGDSVVDATCGNGHDSLILAKLALSDHSGNLLSIDIQQDAIDATQTLLSKQLTPLQLARAKTTLGSHAQFPAEIAKDTITLIVYNLGYLPKGNKSLTTHSTSTIESLNKASELIRSGGAISITCYPGHTEGKNEEQAVLEWASFLDPSLWSSCHHRWLNRKHSPSLLFLQKQA